MATATDLQKCANECANGAVAVNRLAVSRDIEADNTLQKEPESDIYIVIV